MRAALSEGVARGWVRMVAVLRVAMAGARSMAAVLISEIHLSATLAEPAHFSMLEVALLLLGTAISLALFFQRLGPILRTIFRSKKDTDFSLYPIGRRVWDFVWEVLCQGKVIRQRPLPGLAHAFVFWGFLAFALVSLNHVANAVGLGFLSPTSYLGSFYFLFAAVWALLVAVSITALFVRRFFVRPV